MSVPWLVIFLKRSTNLITRISDILKENMGREQVNGSSHIWIWCTDTIMVLVSADPVSSSRHIIRGARTQRGYDWRWNTRRPSTIRHRQPGNRLCDNSSLVNTSAIIPSPVNHINLSAIDYRFPWPTRYNLLNSIHTVVDSPERWYTIRNTQNSNVLRGNCPHTNTKALLLLEMKDF